VVADNPAAGRYEALLDGRVVAYSEYRTIRNRVVFTHTQVDPALEGRGIGSRLAAGVFDDLRARGITARIKCPFLAAYLGRHPEDGDVVARPAP
jgi:predicted GNAT family acetyltransferase